MLYVNEVLLNMADKENPYVKEFLAGKAEIEKKYKFPLIFKDKFGRRMNPTGAVEPAKIISIPLKAAQDTNLGRVYWRFSTSLGVRQQKRLTFKDILKVEKHEIELAFFLLYKSNIVKEGQIKLVDHAKDARETVLAKGRMISTRYFLYDKSSPYFDDEERLRVVALSFGVPRANNKDFTIDQVKLALENVIQGAEENNDEERNEEAFKKALDIDELVRQKAAIQEAIDLKVLNYVLDRQGWFLLDNAGRVREKILPIAAPEVDARFDKLVKLLLRDSYYRDMVEEAIGKRGIFNHEDHTQESLTNMEYKALQNLAARSGIPSVGKSREVLVKDLCAKFGL